MCLASPPEAAARAECLNWLHDNQVSDSESFACMHFSSDFTSVVLKSFFEAVSNRWESRVRALERVHGSGSAVRVIGPQASVAAVMEAFDTPSNPGRPPKRKFESAFRPQSLAVVPSPKCPPEPPMDKRKLAHVQTLWSIARSFPDFCPKSDKWRSLSEPLREVYREQVFKHLGSFSLSALSGAIRTWSRYLAFLSFLPTPRPPPLPAQASYLSVFLVFVGRGDKTTKASKSGKLKGGGGAARSVLNGLVFLRDHLELQLPVDDSDVRSSGVDAPVARRGQATPASPQVLRALGTLAASRNKIVSFLLRLPLS